MKPINIPLILLAVAAFLCPVAGGHVPLEVSTLEPGFMPGLMAAFWSFDAPSLSHMVLGLLVVGSMIGAFVSNKVVQVPSARIAAPLLGFLALLAFSIAVSGFKMVSLPSLVEWLVYGCAFFAVVACAGRSTGPRILLTAIFAGCVVAALRGYLGDFYTAQGDVRIFGGWQQPNALAGILLIGLLIGFGLVMTAERLEALIIGIGLTLITLAISLTQSKGGYLAAGLAVVTFTLLLLWQKRPFFLSFLLLALLDVGLYVAGARGMLLLAALLITLAATVWFLYSAVGMRVLRVAGALGATVVLIVLIIFRPAPAGPNAPAGPAFARVAAPANTGDQSVKYRINLWKTTIELVKMNPAGTGLNTFQFHGARPGLVSSGTIYAHQSFLQLAAEASPLSAIFLLAFLVLILRELIRGFTKAPPEVAILRGAVFAALVGATAHCLVESNLYIMGFGLVYFMLMGLALQMSYDGSAPELVPKEGRWSLAMTGAVVGLMVLYFGYIGTLKARVRGDLQAGNLSDAAAGIGQLLSLAPTDGEAHYLASGMARVGGNGLPVTAEKALSEVAKTVRLKPMPRYFRTLARVLVSQDRAPQALTTLDKALYWDPNNMDALYQKLEIQRQLKDVKAAKATAKQLIAIEETSAFKIRALPEVVPLESYLARRFLADQESDPSRKVALVQEAVNGYRRFSWFIQNNIGTGQLSKEEAVMRMHEAVQMSEELGRLYRQLHREKDAQDAVGLVKEFSDILKTLT